jgi:hypothetical protein
MVLDSRGLPRSAAEALGFFLGLKIPNAVKAPGAEIPRYPLWWYPRKFYGGIPGN